MTSNEWWSNHLPTTQLDVRPANQLDDGPANRLDVGYSNGKYGAWEIRRGTAILPGQQFDTIEQLITYAKRYAGMVWAAPVVRSAMQSAGLLLVRDV